MADYTFKVNSILCAAQLQLNSFMWCSSAGLNKGDLLLLSIMLFLYFLYHISVCARCSLYNNDSSPQQHTRLIKVFYNKCTVHTTYNIL